MTFIFSGSVAQALAVPVEQVVGHGPRDSDGDCAIERTVRSMLADAPLDRTAAIDVTVCGGVVTLGGTVSDGMWLARFKNQLTGALPSVVIDDRLDWVVPDCGAGAA